MRNKKNVWYDIVFHIPIGRAFITHHVESENDKAEWISSYKAISALMPAVDLCLLATSTIKLFIHNSKVATLATVFPSLVTTHF